jgi:hypothetical protein
MKRRIDNRTIETCSRAFARHPTYGPADQAIAKLVRLLPSNGKLDEVLLKVVAINVLYATRIYSAFRMAEHIARIDELDKLLAEGSIAAVDKIRTGHGIRRKLSRADIDFYSFATKYCSFHNGDSYPLFDDIVSTLLKDLVPGRRNLRNYAIFKETIDQMRKDYSISFGNYKELDMGLWVYGGYTGRRIGQSTDQREQEFYSYVASQLEGAQTSV